MIKFNSMSTSLGLFYGEKLGDSIHCMFTFFVQLFKFLAHNYMISRILIYYE